MGVHLGGPWELDRESHPGVELKQRESFPSDQALVLDQGLSEDTSCVNKLRVTALHCTTWDSCQLVKPKWEEFVEREHGRRAPQNVSGFL
jgi:hypothetical protein